VQFDLRDGMGKNKNQIDFLHPEGRDGVHGQWHHVDAPERLDA
jgi:hypothetical protein